MSRPKSIATVATVDIEDGVLVYSAHQGSVISLNSSARAIWKRCDGLLTAEEICRQIAGELGVSAEDLMPDVELGLKQLEEAGLIAWTPSPTLS